MKILVTGAEGQLGKEIVQMLQANGENVIGIGRKELDLSKSEQVAISIATYKADWVINCAAYTKVDHAEEERELAFLVNRDAAKAVAEGVKIYGGRLLHVSTDFIFDGSQSHPYKENDTAHPLGVYGQSKFEGEQAVLEVMPEAVIVRTAWVYGIHGHNFVKTILKLAAEREELTVVDDQIGTPSWTADIAKAIYALINISAKGIYHFTNEGVASWYDFAQQVVITAQNLGFSVKAKRICPIPTNDFPTLAKRPEYSVLSKGKIRPILDHDIPHWQQSLEDMLKQLQNSQRVST